MKGRHRTLDLHRAGRRLPRVGALVVVAGLVIALGVPMTAVGKPDKVTICHAAGQAGTDKFVTLELSPSALDAHFDEHGSPRAGHEGDYMGECTVEETPTTLVVETAPTSEESTTTSTTATTVAVAETVVTTEDSTTTTTTAVAQAAPTTIVTTTTTDSAGLAVEAQTDTTTTLPQDESDPENLSADAAAAADEAPASEDDESGTETGSTPESQDVGATETLPYTGSTGSMALPGSLMLVLGAFLVFVTGGLRRSDGAHVSPTSLRFGLGLHRGRHE